MFVVAAVTRDIGKKATSSVGSARAARPHLASRAPVGRAEAPLPGGFVWAPRKEQLRLHFRRPPRAALLADLDPREVLFARRALRPYPIASLTKIASALVAVRHFAPTERVRIAPAALRYSGSGMGVLRPGLRVRAETLLAGMLVVSGNDAALALALAAGGQHRFVGEMNDLARSLGLRCTHFRDPHGLSPKDRSCAADLVVLARAAMAQPRIRRIVSRRAAPYPFPIRGGRLWLVTHNPLLRTSYPGTIGLKTGFTAAAGRCLVAVVRRRGRTLVAVVLGSTNPAAHARALFDTAFDQPHSRHGQLSPLS
ncbi:D-alanyl-D-alanine carboxypeptidase [Thermoleophilum album]|uniref:D-alanyl-D-alanine carboxypeptidase family protein n=1 Tax=Thermoleophilum album TaxID=29539 RepID=UPI00237CF0E5|nr:serine hydrolase [Thermoleophilum album]WDT93752.1 D-alanyl-D-alanine carboxypeptidase [Thermoleophilum album]